MPTVEKFDFGVDFDAPEPTLPEGPGDEGFVEEEIIVIPTFSGEELAAARAESLAQGRAEASAEAKESTEHRTLLALEAVRGSLDGLGDTVAQALLQRERDAVSLAAAIARKVLPEIARDSAVEALEAFIADCMEKVRDEPRLVIRVNDAIAKPLRDNMAEIAADKGYPGDVAVLADETLAVTDCHIEWGEGGTEYESGEIWGEIERLIESFLEGYARRIVAPPPAPEDDIAAAPEDSPPGEEPSIGD